MSVELDGANNTVKTDTISEITSANGITIDGLSIKDSKLVTANSVIEANMSANSVDSDSYVDGSIDTAHISADAVTGAKIADDAINSEHYTDGSIDTAHLADGQVTIGKLATAVLTGATDIGAAIVDADLLLVDDGAGGTLRKTTAARIKTYIGTNTPSFFVRSASSQTPSNNTSTLVVLGTEVFDTDSAFASNAFTVPTGKAGKYFFHGNVRTRNTADVNDLAYVNLFLNGSTVANNMAEIEVDMGNAGKFRNYTQQVSVILDLADGDVVNLYAKLNVGSGTPLFDVSNFMGYKLI